MANKTPTTNMANGTSIFSIGDIYLQNGLVFQFVMLVTCGPGLKSNLSTFKSFFRSLGSIPSTWHHETMLIPSLGVKHRMRWPIL